MGFRSFNIEKKYGQQNRGFSHIPRPLFDEFPNAKFGYALRKLKSDYTGAAIRVKRTSDNTEMDIGFLLDNSLDISALLNFVGNSDGLVVILYDQSENGIDVDVQVIDDRLPKIIISGVLQESNNLPAIDFDGGEDVITSTNLLSTPATQLFIFGVWQKTIIDDNPTNFNLDAPNFTSLARVSGNAPRFSGTAILWDAGSVADRLISPSGFNDLFQHQYAFTKIIGVDNQTIRRDGLQIAQRTQRSTDAVVSKVAIGSDGDGSIGGAAMLFQELIYYDTDELDNIVGIENNIMKYYSI